MPGRLPHDQLTPARLAEMQAAFERALALEGTDRERYLGHLAESDGALASRVRALLAAHERTGSGFVSPLGHRTALPLDGTTDRWIGARVGAYVIARLVGAGGMGTVYEATRADDQYRHRVAIKLLGQHAGNEATIQRFRQERQILATLNHPNIASLLDGGVTDDGQPWFAMEYIEGEPITRWCDARRMPLAARLQLFQQVCSAVQYAHQSLVVHRDLKPGNILVTAAGAVKLLDFGIAKLMPEALAADPDDTPLTRTGVRAYTPEYASP
ncbi:partial Serine/threonine-protein kinase PknA, partial [Gammaproteobacteria bacterium]